MKNIFSNTKQYKEVIVLSVGINLVVTVGVFVLAYFFVTEEGGIKNFFSRSGNLQNTSGGVLVARDIEGLPAQAGEESQIVRAVEKANPAVVSIVITKDVPILERYYEQYSPFEDFFGDEFQFQVPRFREKGTEKQEIGGGSGFIVSSGGLVVTNKHVVEEEDVDYTVFLNDGKKYDAKVTAKDAFFDIAILQINDGKDFPYLEFGDSDSLKSGQAVIAIGNALGEFRNSVSVGVISGLSRSIIAGGARGGIEQLEGVIQTDAAINPGNSGGPLLDLSGRVIGVNVAMARGSENIGFAIPSLLVAGVVESVEKYGEIVRPYLGVRYVEINQQIQEKNNLSVDYGVLVIRGENIEDLAVVPGSPANKAGIVENDIILEVDGVKLGKGNSLASMIRQKSVGDLITLTILHRGKEITVRVTLEKAPKGL